MVFTGGSNKEQTSFWVVFKAAIKIDPEEFIDTKGIKILGRLHKMHRSITNLIITMIYDMRSYAKGTVELDCELLGIEPHHFKAMTTPCLSESHMTDEEIACEGTLHKVVSRILMKGLWLSRLCRSDLVFAIDRFASRVSKWTRWEDRRLLRPVSYFNARIDFVMKVSVDV